MIDTRYAYSVANVRARENYLLDEGWYERFLKEDEQGELRMLKEYSQEFSDALTSRSAGEILEKKWAEELELIDRLFVDRELGSIFGLAYDFNNLDILIRARQLNRVDRISVSNIGTTPVEIIKKAVVEENPYLLDGVLKEALLSAEEKLKNNGSLTDVSWVLENFRWGDILSKVKKAGSIFLADFFRTAIDLVNIKSGFQIFEERKEERLYWIDGGYIDTFTLEELFHQSFDVIVRRLGVWPYGKLAEKFSKDKSLWQYEWGSENLLLGKLKNSRTLFFGPEPLVAYLYLKKREISLVQSAVTGKVNKISKEDLLKGENSIL